MGHCGVPDTLPAKRAALTAATLNAACSPGRGDTVGTVEPGKVADLILVDAPSVDAFVTDLSANRVVGVLRKGVPVVRVA